MAVRQGNRYRIYPDADQAQLLRKALGCRRYVRNLCLERIEAERALPEPRKITVIDQINEITALKARPETAWLAEVPHHVLQQAVVDLHDALKRFFSGQCAWPKRLKKGRRDSCRFPDATQFEWNDLGIRLPKLGWIEWVMHRPVEGEPKSVTVSLDADAWYVSVLTELPDSAEAPAGSNVNPDVGVDINTLDSIVLSTGRVIRFPRVSEKEWAALAALQRRLARQVKGSNNRRKTKLKIARMYAKWRRRRMDAIHKATTDLAKNHGLVSVEDLRVKNMTASARGTVEEPGRNVRQKAGRNRSFLDTAPGTIVLKLVHKCRKWGGEARKVDPAFTSQDCSKCDHRDAASRVGDRFRCTACGHAESAHVNAAKNVRKRGLAQGGPKKAKPRKPRGTMFGKRKDKAAQAA